MTKPPYLHNSWEDRSNRLRVEDIKVGQTFYQYDGGGHWGHLDGVVTDMGDNFILIKWKRRNVNDEDPFLRKYSPVELQTYFDNESIERPQ